MPAPCHVARSAVNGLRRATPTECPRRRLRLPQHTRYPESTVRCTQPDALGCVITSPAMSKQMGNANLSSSAAMASAKQVQVYRRAPASSLPMPARYAKRQSDRAQGRMAGEFVNEDNRERRAQGAQSGSITVPGTPPPYITLNVAMKIDDAQTQCDEGPWNQFPRGHQHQRCVEPDTPDDRQAERGLGAGGADHQQSLSAPTGQGHRRPPCC